MKETLIEKGIGPEKYPGQFDLIAKYVSGWTEKQEMVLPKKPEDIKKMLVTIPTVTTWGKNKDGVVPMGFGAITKLWPDNWAELGSVILDQTYAEMGLGQYLVKSLIYLAQNMYPEKNFFALCNENNLKYFLDNGAKIVDDQSILPKEISEYKLVEAPISKLVVI